MEQEIEQKREERMLLETQDWKLELRKQIYRQNRLQISLNQIRQRRNPQQPLADSIRSLTSIKKCTINTKEPPLPTYKCHSARSFYIPVRQQVNMPSQVEHVFKKWLGSNAPNVQKKIQSMINFFKQNDQLPIAYKWRQLVQKYVCPLSLLEKIEYYQDLIKNGTKNLLELWKEKYPKLSLKLLLDSVMQAKTFLQSQSDQAKAEPTIQSNPYMKYYCGYCYTYGCIVHIPISANGQVISKKPFKQSDRFQQASDYRILSLIQLMCQIRQYFIKNPDSREHEKEKCSYHCYRNLSFRDIQAGFQEFSLTKDVSDYKKVKSIAEVFGYRPCQLARISQVSCEKVLILILLQNPKRLSSSAGIDQATYLKNISKFPKRSVAQGCSCRKGHCKNNSCQCYLNNRECSSQTCQCQSLVSNLLGSDSCPNHDLLSRKLPLIRIGASVQKDQRLGLFTMARIQQEQLVLRVSGQYLPQGLWNELQEVLMNRSGEPACNLIFGNTNGTILSGKYRFLYHSNSQISNLRRTTKFIKGLEYTLLYAKCTIQPGEELILECRCGLLLNQVKRIPEEPAKELSSGLEQELPSELPQELPSELPSEIAEQSSWQYSEQGQCSSGNSPLW